jgi:predicted enzyme related to lactoylglutathione lyase
MASGVVHFEIIGKDGAKAREFYGKLFGWEYQVMEEMNYGLVAPAGEGSIGGGVGGTMPNVPPYLTFYVQVDDLAASLKKAESLGGKIVLPPTPIPGTGACALFSDPDGNIVGLFKPGA